MLPPKHPLYTIACKVAHHFINCHKSLLHYLFHLTQLHPDALETISPAQRHLSYIPSFMTKISLSKEMALTLTQRSFCSAQYKVYSDSSCIDIGVGASAILYKNDKIVKVCRYYLGTPNNHTVYKAELTSVLLTIHLLHKLSCQLTRTTILGLDNQLVI